MERDRAAAVLIDRRGHPMPKACFTFSFFITVFLAMLSLANSDCDVQLGALSQECDLKHWSLRTSDGSIENLLPTCCEAVEETFDLLEGETESCICRLLHRDALDFEISPVDVAALISVCPFQSKPTCLFSGYPKVPEDKLSFKDKCYIAAAAIGMIAALLGCCASAITCYRDARKKSAKSSPPRTPPLSMKTEKTSPSSHQGSRSSATKRHKKSGGSAGSTGQP